MTDTTTRRFEIGEIVRLVDAASIGEAGNDSATILDYVAPESEAELLLVEAQGPGPLYVVNVGNVHGHGGMYEYTLAESQLVAWPEFYGGHEQLGAWRRWARKQEQSQRGDLMAWVIDSGQGVPLRFNHTTKEN